MALEKVYIQVDVCMALCANCNSHEDDRLYLPYMAHQGIIIDTNSRNLVSMA